MPNTDILIEPFNKIMRMVNEDLLEWGAKNE